MVLEGGQGRPGQVGGESLPALSLVELPPKPEKWQGKARVGHTHSREGMGERKCLSTMGVGEGESNWWQPPGFKVPPIPTLTTLRNRQHTEGNRNGGLEDTGRWELGGKCARTTTASSSKSQPHTKQNTQMHIVSSSCLGWGKGREDHCRWEGNGKELHWCVEYQSLAYVWGRAITGVR